MGSSLNEGTCDAAVQVERARLATQIPLGYPKIS